ncbi:ribosome-associated translation inhibitor RaiA [Metallumcola ferriviriculae]|uniref:Ribosome hibernation promoting factor n=1 Tax=Metallumcola ferriviriculae TaxID=3039180 RepID=A0AAU0UL79_9FIRM|nr:ribosome-associated translation inhibitor RaiA [Desulfitibacteraceae bacterium MK1]
MNIIVRGKQVNVTNALRQHVEKRVGKLEKYLDELEEAQVTLSVEKDRHRVEVTIPVKGIIIRGEEESGDMYGSVDAVIEKLEKQIKKYKTKLAKKTRLNGLRELVAQSQGNGADEEEEPQVLRTKRFAIKPMPVDEAIMQMNLLGHNFFVFSNAETEQVNVVYQRKDGNYGLIEPEF